MVTDILTTSWGRGETGRKKECESLEEEKPTRWLFALLYVCSRIIKSQLTSRSILEDYVSSIFIATLFFIFNKLLLIHPWVRGHPLGHGQPSNSHPPQKNNSPSLINYQKLFIRRVGPQKPPFLSWSCMGLIQKMVQVCAIYVTSRGQHPHSKAVISFLPFLPRNFLSTERRC